MNILFVLYGDFSSNTANPVLLFGKTLISLGHEVALTLPYGLEAPGPIFKNDIACYSFEEVLKRKGAIFSSDQLADIIHACTPRINVFQFIRSYETQFPTPLVIYLEDNETWIANHYLRSEGHLQAPLSSQELQNLLPATLSHPNEYPFFIAMADFVITIQDKLQVEVPLGIPSASVPWGVDLALFHPVANPILEGLPVALPTGARVIVYHGGLNGFTYGPIRDLCDAVIRINQAGVKCILLRTGVNSLYFLNELPSEAKDCIFDLGVVKRLELPGILALADVLVQPGRIDLFEDLRLPSKVPEFLATGKPVLLPNVNIAHQFEDGVNAIILKEGTPEEIAKRCLELFPNPQKMEALGKAAREFALTHFDIQKQTQALLAAYSQAQANFQRDITQEVWQVAAAKGIGAGAVRRFERLSDLAILDLNFERLRLLIKQLGLWVNSQYARAQELAVRIDALSEKVEASQSAQAQLQTLQNSLSWRLTAPIRGLLRKLRS